jgi:hypothetical protein
LVHYMFETDWVLTAPIEQVFDVLSHPETFEEWWPSVINSTLVSEGDADGLSARARYTIESPLLYRMTFDLRTIDVERPNRLRAVVRGDLVGTGTFHLERVGAGTLVRFDWYVATTKRWMNIAAFLAKPVLAWAHGRIMLQGCEAMAAHLGARLVSADSGVAATQPPAPTVQQESR